jgi:hypothetical protein
MTKKVRSYIVLYTTVALIVISYGCTGATNTSATETVSRVYPQPPDTSRIVYLTTISASSDIRESRSGINRFMFGDEEVVEITKPYGVSTMESGLLICDTGIAGIISIDFQNNRFIRFVPDGPGKLKLPLNCDTDSKGNIYVADGNRREIVVFDKNFGFITAFGNADSLFRPTDIAIAGDTIWIASVANHHVYAYSSADYSLILTLPPTKPGMPGYLYQPSNINCTNGMVYVTDVGDYSVKIFNTSGKYIRSAGGYGNRPGQMMRPKGVVTDKNGITYVVDAAFENVQLFDESSRLLMFFGGSYHSPGDMWLPADVEIDYGNVEWFSRYAGDYKLQYIIYVTNQYGPGKVNVYGFINNEHE